MFSSLLLPMRRRLFLSIASRLECGSVDITLADGTTHSYAGPHKGPHADVSFLTDRALTWVIKDGKMGFCEAYMAGEVTSTDLSCLIEVAAMNIDHLDSKLGINTLSNAVNQIFKWRHQNSRSGSRKNIAYHYDLGNNFYSSWLDESMTYSSAVFANDDMDLAAAQELKYEKLAQLADIQPGDRVLEIGCGWGGFAEYAARTHDAHVTGITISRAQFDYATKRLKDANLADKTDIQLKDYRDIDQKFDKIVSIEMFEAVGETYWPSYFSTVSNCLRPGGKAALQVITIADEMFHIYKAQPDFIQRYIFPGGMLPSMTALAPPLQQAGLKLVSETGYAQDYARTLAVWKEQFHNAWPDLAKTCRFDERFKLMWELYLSYCEGGFKAGNIDVKQMLITHN